MAGLSCPGGQRVAVMFYLGLGWNGSVGVCSLFARFCCGRVGIANYGY